VAWLAICAVFEVLTDKQRALRLLPALIVGVLAARVFVVRATLSWAEIAGACAGFALWLLLVRLSWRARAGSILLAVAAYVILWRLYPTTSDVAEFGWVPFHGFLRGSLYVNVQSFFEKTFYYGALLWLVTAAGARLRVAAVGVALSVLTMSLLAYYVVGRSAEITDAVIVILLALATYLLRPQPPAVAASRGSRG
jgi:hypothetical protein